MSLKASFSEPKNILLFSRWSQRKKQSFMVKEEIIKFRCTALEKAIIEDKAENSGHSISAYCRHSALNKNIGFKLTPEELRAYEMLVEYHNNFARITNVFKEKDSNFVREMRETAAEIKRHLQKFK